MNRTARETVLKRLPIGAAVNWYHGGKVWAILKQRLNARLTVRPGQIFGRIANQRRSGVTGNAPRKPSISAHCLSGLRPGLYNYRMNCRIV
jgi:hypothetical protein